MNIVQMVEANPSLFYAQSWYANEQFARAAASDGRICPPKSVKRLGKMPKGTIYLVRAADLVALYVDHPNHPAFLDYLWTSDLDSFGQRIYVGGTRSGRGLEIHRHLHISPRFGQPSWI